MRVTVGGQTLLTGLVCTVLVPSLRLVAESHMKRSVAAFLIDPFRGFFCCYFVFSTLRLLRHFSQMVWFSVLLLWVVSPSCRVFLVALFCSLPACFEIGPARRRPISSALPGFRSRRGGGPARRRPPGARTDRPGRLPGPSRVVRFAPVVLFRVFLSLSFFFFFFLIRSLFSPVKFFATQACSRLGCFSAGLWLSPLHLVNNFVSRLFARFAATTSKKSQPCMSQAPDKAVAVLLWGSIGAEDNSHEVLVFFCVVLFFLFPFSSLSFLRSF